MWSYRSTFQRLCFHHLGLMGEFCVHILYSYKDVIWPIQVAWDRVWQWCSVPAEITWGAVGEISQSWESISCDSDYTMGLGWKWILLDAEYSYLKLFTNNHSWSVFHGILAWILSTFLPQTLLLDCRLR
jgi:hypothetical protein